MKQIETRIVLTKICMVIGAIALITMIVFFIF